ncbi:MAG: hypothetical protein IJ942_03215 [Alistipes sp.]|nr:hypothetical protein [Alistipes sp.]MBR2116011.1 hypothetical protein [Alistipes sp.]
MEVLKLTSIRLSKKALGRAGILGSSLGYGRSSDIIRIAIWIGLKALKPGVLRGIMHMMWEEEEGIATYSLQDVLQNSGIELENLKSQE